MTTPQAGRLAITWFGHSTFVITTPGGKRIVTDPWLEGNPLCPPGMKRITEADLILVSHGHSDHTGDVVAVARATGAPIVAIYELALWLERKGLTNVQGMGIGGTLAIAGVHVTMVPAVHTSSTLEGDTPVYLGVPVGFVVRMEDGQAFYFAGDTAVFGDMALIAEMHAPQIAFLPIGDHFTMGPEGAADRGAPARRAADRADALRHVPGAHRDAGPPEGARRGAGRSTCWSCKAGETAQ